MLTSESAHYITSHRRVFRLGAGTAANQFEECSSAQPTSVFSNLDFPRDRLTIMPANQSHVTPSMAVMVWKALCFDWSMCSLFPPPGPGRIRLQRTERLQKDRVIKATANELNIGPLDKPEPHVTPLNAKLSSQTHAMLIFPILTPRAFFSPMYTTG